MQLHYEIIIEAMLIIMLEDNYKFIVYLEVLCQGKFSIWVRGQMGQNSDSLAYRVKQTQDKDQRVYFECLGKPSDYRYWYYSGCGVTIRNLICQITVVSFDLSDWCGCLHMLFLLCTYISLSNSCQSNASYFWPYIFVAAC